MNLQALATEIYAINKANGWHDGEPRNWDELCELIASEVAEATEARRDPKHTVEEIYYEEDGKPCGTATEHADCAIRALDAAAEHAVTLDEWFVLATGDLDGSLSHWSMQIYQRICDLAYVSTDRARRYSIENIVGICMYLIRALGHDPEKVIREKMEYNRTKRGHRHGGKRL